MARGGSASSAWSPRSLVLAGILVFRIVRRLTTEFSYPALALVLERRYPKVLGDRLITAVEMADVDESAKYGYSADMIRQTINEARERVGTVDVHAVFNWRRLQADGAPGHRHSARRSWPSPSRRHAISARDVPARSRRLEALPRQHHRRRARSPLVGYALAAPRAPGTPGRCKGRPARRSRRRAAARAGQVVPVGGRGPLARRRLAAAHVERGRPVPRRRRRARGAVPQSRLPERAEPPLGRAWPPWSVLPGWNRRRTRTPSSPRQRPTGPSTPSTSAPRRRSRRLAGRGGLGTAPGGPAQGANGGGRIPATPGRLRPARRAGRRPLLRPQAPQARPARSGDLRLHGRPHRRQRHFQARGQRRIRRRDHRTEGRRAASWSRPRTTARGRNRSRSSRRRP